MAEITDEYMRDMLTKSKAYSVVFLRATPKRYEPGAAAIVWEHGRRNFALRAEGAMSLVCPITDEGEWRGVAICDAPPDEVARMMDGDPGVQAGIFTYEVHPIRGFPGDSLPA